MTKLLVFAINIIYVSFSGSSASHSFIVESKAKGMFHGSPAVIKFHIPTKAALQEAYYTPIQPLDVLADKPPEKKFECVRYPHMPAFICYTLVVSFVLSLTMFGCNFHVISPFQNHHVVIQPGSGKASLPKSNHCCAEAVSKVWISGGHSDTGQTVLLPDCGSIENEQEEAVIFSIWWMLA
ncbi:hypothetical protein GW17_00031778 [Ensete ventricosum]|nr:hypothetical protein GW17_00031778 [Ensete ventricosum]